MVSTPRSAPSDASPSPVAGWKTAALVLIAVGVRCLFLDHITSDMRGCFLPWYKQIVADGGIVALRRPFGVYSPAYFYFLTLATYLHGVVRPIVAVKTVSFVFDFSSAALVYGLVRLRHPSGDLAWFAAACALLAPTVVTNSAYWGQCDAVYTAFLVACVYSLSLRRPIAAMLCYSVALSIKLQAIFLGPLLLGLFLRREIPWKCVVLPFAVYLAFALPCAVLGRPWSDLLSIYPEQTGHFSRFLTLSAPSIFALLRGLDPSYAWMGVVVAAAFGLFLAATLFASRRAMDVSLLVKGGVLCLASMPFLLPRMHDRYFYPADVLSIALGFCEPRMWLVPIAFQVSSMVAYGPYLAGHPVVPIPAAAAVNLVLVAVLFVSWWRDLNAEVASVPSP